MKNTHEIFSFRKMFLVFLSIVVLVLFLGGPEAYAATPNISYSRHPKLNACDSQHAEKIAESALRQAGSRNARLERTGVVSDSNSNSEAFIFIEDGNQAIVFFAGRRAIEIQRSISNSIDNISNLNKALECGTDRPGGDYANFSTSGDPLDCMRACSANSFCRSFTYVKPARQNDSGRCWLKNSIPERVANSNTISGRF